MRIILDESLLWSDQLSAYADTADLFIANIRISKNGGLLRSIVIACEAVNRGIPLIFGAHVGETTVLRRSALSVANGFADAVLAREGGFGRLLIKQDAVSPSMHFGKGGMLSPRRYLQASYFGSGLTVIPEILQQIAVESAQPDD
ncbi:MAG: hypothetical protein GY789_04655 [Hyphomicrobiales bacterium]|nr:hypothetical protein [Hyphomicrobiales bacterium]MCP5000277.1 hypothetical protein [Hyphomicrobiales bacterium]